MLSLLVLAAPGCASTATDAALPDVAQAPAVARLDTPENAVRSYLEWISYAYRIGDPDVATPALTPEEAVRVDAYVQLNAQQGRVIAQRLSSLDLTVAEQAEPTATVTARERWVYRYISLSTERYSGPWHRASYDTTYSVIRGEDGLWRVGSVEASPRGAVK